MSFEIRNWNLSPNIKWYVKVTQNTTNILIDLYLNADDALNSANVIASGTADYETDGDVVLEQIATSPVISLFNSATLYHLMVYGTPEDATITYAISAFVDIDPITDNIYRSDDLVDAKSLSEINKHTHLSKLRDVALSKHNPLFAVGDQIEIPLNDSSVLTILEELTISGTVNSLTNQIQTIEYVDIKNG